MDEADVIELNTISHLFLNSLQFSLADSEEKGSLLPKSNVGRSVDSSKNLAKNQLGLHRYFGVTWDPILQHDGFAAAQQRALTGDPVVEGEHDPGTPGEIIFLELKVR